MKEFKDLEFKDHAVGFGGKHAFMHFDNGYGVSVVSGSLFYTSNEYPYEVAVLSKTETGFSICYDTPITDDVLGYLTEEAVTETMRQVQEL